MNALQMGNDQPINIQASKIFWKSPWWAKINEPEKQTAQRALNPKTNQLKMEDILNLANPAPLNVIDLRGSRIEIIQHGKPTMGLIVGFADARQKIRHRIKRREKPPWWIGDGWEERRLRSEIENKYAWWALIFSENPFYLRIVNKERNQRGWRFLNEPISKGMKRLMGRFSTDL